MINITALGRLTDTPVLHTVGDDKAVCKFRIACNRGAFEGSDFLSVETWRAAKINAEKLEKGQQVHITGTIRTSEWTDEDGNQRSRTFINADNITWLSKAGAARQSEETTS